jgi:hypothetical protein
MHLPLFTTSFEPAQTLAAIQTSWAIFWIVVLALIVIAILLTLFRFTPDFIRYMRIKAM